MTITTLAQVKSGLRPPVVYDKVLANHNFGSFPWETSWGGGIFPPAGAYDSTLNGVTLSGEVTGAIFRTNPATGNAHIARITHISGSAQFRPNLIVCDRLWHNGGIDVTSTSPQAITSPTWPARDRNGSTNGVGVYLALEVSATVGAATPTITIDYTNQAGTAGRTGTNIIATVSASVANMMYWIGLQAGDTGVRSVQSITLSASWISGTINLVAFRPLLHVPARAGVINYTTVCDVLSGNMPRILDDSVLYFIGTRSSQASTSLLVMGDYVETQG